MSAELLKMFETLFLITEYYVDFTLEWEYEGKLTTIGHILDRADKILQKAERQQDIKEEVERNGANENTIYSSCTD